MSRFMDENGSGDYLHIAADDVVGFRVGVRPGAPPIVNLSSSDARAVAAEIIACADRIDPPKKEPRKCKACGFTGNHSHYMTCLECDAILNDVPVTRGVDALVNPTTPAHTSHESLVSLAKAIAYLPASLRDELNALLAVKLREALK